MYFSGRIFAHTFDYRILRTTLSFICLHAICDAAINDHVNITELAGQKYFPEGGKLSRVTNNVVVALCRDFKYPVETRLEFTGFKLAKNEPLQTTARFRRDDKTVSDKNSGKDYMSIYYAQRRAIMDKYKSQQREIMERLKKTKSLIAESKKLKESKKIDLDETLDSSNPNITTFDKRNSTIITNSTISRTDFDQTTGNTTTENSVLISTIFTDTGNSVSNSSESFLPSSKEQSLNDSTETHYSSGTTPSPIHATLRPFVINGMQETLKSVNSIPENEVDFHLTDENSVVRNERDNDTVLIDLKGYAVDPTSSNDSALNQLEEMFLWEVPSSDETISPSDASMKIGNNSPTENSNTNSTGVLDSLRFMVEIKSSPEVHVSKNITNVQTSTTTYRNSTHEIVEINGVVNSTREIGVSPDVDLPDLKNTDSPTREVATDAVQSEGGARESEWCEECPHDYRWGNCEGTLFYQHNIFLRNRGPSAIDAIFGMNVQGPVYITCVEAIRFNKTRGIVTLHSGGPDHDFAKLRIRGFEGEGFSYITKVWGVSDEKKSIENVGDP